VSKIVSVCDFMYVSIQVRRNPLIELVCVDGRYLCISRMSERKNPRDRHEIGARYINAQNWRLGGEGRESVCERKRREK